MKENGLKLTKERSRRYPTQTITKYADYIVLLANAPAQTESLVHRLERSTGGISLHVNADKTEYMSFNQRCDISTLKGDPFETGRQVHLPRKKRLINLERHQLVTSKGMNSYRLAIGHMEIRPGR